MSKLIKYEGSGEWSALYVDGNLEVVGDHYVIDERIFDLLGVQVRQSDDFLQGGDARENCLPTVKDVEDASEARERGIEQAQVLREQAAKLIDEADQLEGKRS